MNVFSRDDQAVIDASSEISLGESPDWSERLLKAFPAFHLKNYKLYFVGQLVSLVGTWLQVVAEGYLVFQLSHSAFYVGLITALGLLPILFFSLFGGVIVDRYNTRSILLLTQTSAMILALLYGILVLMHHISIPIIGVLAFLLGTVNALDMPARQSFIVQLVGKEYLASAIALNSGMFNGARVIGPGVAGFLIAFIGVGGAFIVNGISYIASIITLFFMDVTPREAQTHPHPFTAIADGIKYSFSHKTVRDLLLFAGGMSIFGWSYSTLLPVIANNNATVLGYFYAASGLGALSAAVVVSIFAKKFSPMKFVLGGNVLFLAALITFCFVPNFLLRLPLLVLSGFGLLLQFSTMMTLMQFIISDELRGRVMSIYTIMFLGLSPVGSFEIGLAADRFGTTPAILINLFCLLGFILYLYTKRGYINKAYAEHAHHPLPAK